jgi:hypothetical protein
MPYTKVEIFFARALIHINSVEKQLSKQNALDGSGPDMALRAVAMSALGH